MRKCLESLETWNQALGPEETLIPGSWVCLYADYLRKGKRPKKLIIVTTPRKKVSEPNGTQSRQSRTQSRSIMEKQQSTSGKPNQAHRLNGNRFALTRKPLEEGLEVNLGDLSTFSANLMDPVLRLDQSVTLRLQPPGGVPRLPAGAIIEVVGNVYGQNDGSAAWFKKSLAQFGTNVRCWDGM